MTPTEDYAAKRAQAESLVRQHAPARLQSGLIGLLQPAIALTATRANDEDIAVGASKFGGAPDVPADFEWPNWDDFPLGFLAQINLEEVAPLDLEKVLPKSGVLLFFMGMRAGHDWVYSSEDVGGWRVFYFPDQVLARRDWPAELEGQIEIEAATISFDAAWSWTDWFDLAPDLPKVRANDSDALYALEQAWKLAFPGRHQMLGHPNLIQDDPRYCAAQSTQRGATRDWRLLLQVDSDDEFGFDYCCYGRVWFVVHERDLQAADFSRTDFEGQQ